MIDDTDADEQEAGERSVSIPLIDTYAALRGEIAAKEARIERLENELAQEYLDAAGDEPPIADTEELTASDGTARIVDVNADDPGSPENWVPETEPLTESGPTPETEPAPNSEPAESSDDHEGETPRTANDADPEQGKAPERRAASEAPDSGLEPVRTAGSGRDAGASTRERRSGDAAGNDSAANVPSDSSTAGEREFGVAMEASSNLTGGSLGSSAGSPRSSDTDEEDDAPSRPDPTADRGERLSVLARRTELRSEAAVVESFVRGIDALDDVTREMLAHYREAGDVAPVDAYVAAGGSGKRQYAYARIRTLRKAGVVEHADAGQYRYALPVLVEEAFDGPVDEGTIDDAVEAIESATDLRE